MNEQSLATRPNEPARPTTVQVFAGFDPATYHALRESIGAGAPAPEFKAHLLLCQRLGLSPVGGQVHLVPREVTVKRGGAFIKEQRWATQIGIDGFRSLAEDHGDYDGQDEPEFQYKIGEDWTDEVRIDEIPYAARVRVYRKSIGRPIMARAYWAQFAALRTYEKEVEGKDGKKTKKRVTEPQAMWKKMPHHMLAKCAEAQALRKAFPRLLGGVHTSDEMGRVPQEVIQGVATEVKEEPQATPRPVRRESEEKFNPADHANGKEEPGDEITDEDVTPADADQAGVSVVVDPEEAARAIDEAEAAKKKEADGG